MHDAKIVAAALTAVIGGCAVGPDYRTPELDTGTGWIEAPAAASEVDLDRWWTAFDDPVLERLVEHALERNLDVRAALARVTEARAVRSATGGLRYPTVDASGQITRQRQSANGPLPIDQIPGLERDQTIYEPRFDAFWELDLFGGTRRAIEAADARIDASVERYHAARVTVAAEVARSYLELRGAQHELVARRAAVATTRSTVALVRLRLEAGDAAEAELAQAEAELAEIEAGLPPIEGRLRAAVLSIGVLLGELPEAELALAGQTPEYTELASYPLGERAELLRRRPDVRGAERMLAAATADLGVVTAELFPKFSISAGGGFQSLDTGDLFESASQTWAIAPRVSWRVLDAGRIRAQVDAAEARVEQAALAYEQTVKHALMDAEIALARYDSGLDALARQQAALDAARTTYGHATSRHRAGDISLLELHDAERALWNAETAYARTHTQTATDLVALFKALGGSWNAPAQG